MVHSAIFTFASTINHEPNFKTEFSSEQLSRKLGIPLLPWDKQAKGFYLSVLSDLLTFKVTEAHKTLSTSRDVSPNQNNEEHELSNQEIQLFEPSSKRKPVHAQLEVQVSDFKIEAHSKRFIGKRYKFPLVLSLISIPGIRVIGVRACFFNPESLKESSAFLPLASTIYNQSEGRVVSEKKIQELSVLFKEKSQEVSFNHLTVNEEFTIEVRRSRESRRVHQIKNHLILPFEKVLLWYTDLQNFKLLSGLSPRDGKRLLRQDSAFSVIEGTDSSKHN